jgi:hypothetical protein
MLLRRALRGGLLNRVTPARVRREIDLVFEEERWTRLGRALKRYGCWKAIIASLAVARADLDRLDALEQLLVWYRGLPQARPPAGWVLGLAYLTRRLPDRARTDLCRRLQPHRAAANDLRQASKQATAVLRALRPARRARPSQVRAACRRASPCACLIALAEARSAAVRKALRDDLERGRQARPDLKGSDLLALGVEPGPGVARGLEAALMAKLDDPGLTRREQLRIARRAAVRT